MAKRSRWRAAGRGTADLPLGSWRRTLVSAAVIVGVFAAAVLVASRTGDLRHASFPGHPYPPAGFYLNPFDPGNPDDLVNTAEAARVKADLAGDGDLELQAFTEGKATLLDQADAGNRLVALREAIARNDQQGVTERWQNSLTSAVVGHLQDPRDSSVVWCVRERGSSTVEFVSRSGGAVVQRQALSFDDRFWLVRSDDRYLITDAQLATTSSSGR